MIRRSFQLLPLFICLLLSPVQGLTQSFPLHPTTGLPDFIRDSTHLLPVVSAHRGGGMYPGYPENCLASFEYIASKVPALIECDVRMSRDSVLLLMHDRSLDRTTNGTGLVANQDWEYIRTLTLKDNQGTQTTYPVPTLAEALAWSKGGVILTLDVKRGVSYQQVISAIKEAESQAYSVVITYNLADALTVHELDSTLLISVSMRNEDERVNAMQSGIPSRNLLAFTGTRLSEPELYQKLGEAKIVSMLGTLGNLDEQARVKGMHLYKKWQGAGLQVFATDYPIEVGEYLKDN
ncbi:MAG: glycerophosphodiester phosphodiesterase family protein [Bacteroidota bacterium]